MAKEKAAPVPPVREMPKYNASTLAEDLGKSPAEVRVLLRKSDIEKPGAVWGWDKKSDYDAVLKSLKAMTTKAAPAKEEKAAKPAKGAKAEKTADAKPARKARAKADA